MAPNRLFYVWRLWLFILQRMFFDCRCQPDRHEVEPRCKLPKGGKCLLEFSLTTRIIQIDSRLPGPLFISSRGSFNLQNDRPWLVRGSWRRQREEKLPAIYMNHTVAGISRYENILKALNRFSDWSLQSSSKYFLSRVLIRRWSNFGDESTFSWMTFDVRFSSALSISHIRCASKLDLIGMTNAPTKQNKKQREVHC